MDKSYYKHFLVNSLERIREGHLWSDDGKVICQCSVVKISDGGGAGGAGSFLVQIHPSAYEQA
jgi:hypothetical protein